MLVKTMQCNASFFATQYDNATTICHLFSRRRYSNN